MFCREEQNLVLPEPGKYATGILFIDKDNEKAAVVVKAFEQLVEEANLQVCCRVLLPLFTSLVPGVMAASGTRDTEVPGSIPAQCTVR